MEENKEKKTTKKSPKKTQPKEVETPVTKTLAELGEVVVVEAIGTTEDEGEKNTPVKTEEIAPNVLPLEEEKQETPEEIVEPEKVTIPDVTNMKVIDHSEVKLSKQAQGWADWLVYNRIAPEDFLKKHPNHKFKNFIQEIIDFEVKK